MPSIPEAFATAIQHHRVGRLREAETIYRQIVASDPNHHDAWHLLGLIASQVGNLQNGVECIQRALTLRPDWPEAHFNLGNNWKRQGKVDIAIACYQRALQLKPDFADAHNNLGLAWREHEDLEQAAATQPHRVSTIQPAADGDVGHREATVGDLRRGVGEERRRAHAGLRQPEAVMAEEQRRPGAAGSEDGAGPDAAFLGDDTTDLARLGVEATHGALLMDRGAAAVVASSPA